MSEDTLPPPATDPGSLHDAKVALCLWLIRSSDEIERLPQDDSARKTLEAWEGAVLYLLADVLARIERCADGSWREPEDRSALAGALATETKHSCAWLDHKVIARYALAHAPRTYRARYNRACYLASLATELTEEVLIELELAFQAGGPALAGYAPTDPYFKKYRTCPEFASLVSRFGGNVSDLSDLRTVGASFAVALSDKGIDSPSGLVLKATVPSQREVLAADLGADPGLVERWALLADLMAQLDLSPAEANLLEAARMGSVDALKPLTGDEDGLVSLLESINRAGQYLDKAPEKGVVHAWLRAAATAQRRIVLRTPGAPT